MYACICAYNTHIFRQTYDIQQICRSLMTHIFVQIAFETRKRHTGFYVFRQGVAQGRSIEGYARGWVLRFAQFVLYEQQLYWHL